MNEKKMGINKGMIISNTILFVVIVGAVIIFKTIFGEENTLIGVTTISLMLMYLGEDLTLHPGKYAVQFVVINLIMGIGTFIAYMNIWAGIVINFVIIFAVAHMFIYDLKKSVYSLFLLQYLFMFFTPITVEQLPKRLLALVVGALAIIGLQLIANRDKLTKSGNKMLDHVMKNLSEQVTLLKREQCNEELTLANCRILKEFRKIIYNRRKDELYLTEEARVKLSLSIALEKVSLSLDRVYNNEEIKESLNQLYSFLEKIRIGIQELDKAKEAQQEAQQLIEIYAHSKDKQILELIHNIAFLNDSLQELRQLDKDKYNWVKNIKELPNRYKCFTKKKYFEVDTVQFSYAIRAAIGLTLTIFIARLFDLSEGRWMAFTVLALLVPIYEVSKKKLKDRLFGTIIGCILSVVLFSIFKNPLIMIIILMSSGYINTYLKEYKYTTIFVTISAVGSAAMTGNPQVLTFNRIILVVLGAVIAMGINKFIFRYDLKDNNNYLNGMYQETINEMIKEVKDIIEGKEDNHHMKNLSVITAMIEDKLMMNNQMIEENREEILIEEWRNIVSNIYHLYIWSSRNQLSSEDKTYVLQALDRFYEKNNGDINQLAKELQTYMDDVSLKVKVSAAI